MKFKIDIECTPKEAREFLGWPDLEEFQRGTMEQVQRRTREYLDSMDPEKLASMWMPMGAQAWETMQKAFTDFASGAAGRKPDDK